MITQLTPCLALTSHVMLDLETLGTGPNAAIISVGACRFNINDGTVYSTFHAKLPFDDTIGHIDAPTVEWWLRQSQEAREALLSGERFSIQEVLGAFSSWIVRASSTVGLWSNGPTFDETVLRAAYRRFDWDFPLSFRVSRDCRTMFMLAKELGIATPPPQGVKHNAVDDAVSQAKSISAIYQELHRSRRSANGAEL